jgi:hypothetical protein
MQHQPDTMPAQTTAAFLANRLATETFLRAVDLLNEITGGDITDGLILNALWCLHLRNTVPPAESLVLSGEWNDAASIHGLARAIRLPYPTVHRHLTTLKRKGLALRTAAGKFALCPGVIESRLGETFRRRSIASDRRFVVGLHRIGMLAGDVSALEREGGLSEAQQDVIFRAGMEVVLLNLLLTAKFHDDLVSGLVYKLIATQNLKYLNEVPPGVGDLFPDDLRRPVTIYSAAKALHMPYETTRRIANQLLERDVFRQIGDQGLIVPADAHRRLDNMTIRRESFRAVEAGIEQMRHAGLSLSFAMS